jgi:hypothetical protein
MTTKLLTFFDSGTLSAAPRACVSRFSRAPEEPLFRAADTRHIPRLRTPLECRWQIDPVTGALAAFWVDASADGGTAASGKETIEAPRYRRKPLRDAGSSAAARLAA